MAVQRLRHALARGVASLIVMARTVAEIMSPELFSIRGTETAGDVLHYLLALDITGAPVLDDAGKPVGFVSVRDAARVDADRVVSSFMSHPVDVIDVDASLEQLADRVCDGGRHHLVCVDQTGRAVGFVSVLDLVRGLRGRPVVHPAAFAPYDRAIGLTWSDPMRLDLGVLADVPSEPGFYTLLVSTPEQADRVVWSEACSDLHQRLEEILTVPLMAPPHLADLVHRDGLQLRFARAPSLKALREALRGRRAVAGPDDAEPEA